MEFTTQLIQVMGLLVILAGATMVFVHLISWIFGNKHSQVRIGLELVLFFSVVYALRNPVLEFTGIHALADDITKGIAFLWFVSLAFSLDALLKRYVWHGVLFHRGESHVPKLLRDGASLLIYAIAIAIVMHFVYEEPITAILATSGAAAFIVGFSAQSTLREIFAGLALSSTKALKIGDYLEIDGIYGCVHDLNWRSVSLHNPHTDSLYIFPNSAVAEKTILNYSEPTERFKNTVRFVVEHSASPELVSRLVLQSLENSRYVLRDPKPDMNVLGFTDLGMEYRIRYYFDGDDPWWDAQGEVCNAIWGVLRRNGIRLAIDRHKLQSGDELADTPWIQEPQDQEHALVPLLDTATLLAELPEPVRRQLAVKAVRRDFTPPECVYLEGEQSDAVFIVASGRLAVNQKSTDGGDAQVGMLTRGAAFGFSSLLEDTPRRESVQALEYTTVYRIDSGLLVELEGAHPQVALQAREHEARTQSEYAACMSTHLEKLQHHEHHRTRAEIIDSLKEHVRDIFKPRMLTELIRSISLKHSEKVILDAVMAGAAMVSAARGPIDDAERAYVVNVLDSLELLHHTDRESGLAVFNELAKAIAEDPDGGSEKAVKALRRVANDHKISHIVTGIAYGATGLHGKPTEGELQALERIAGVLGTSHEAGELSASIQKLSSR
jgi:small-conductance mechanosensitive channel/CRP-like cAMP-binding protein